MKRELYHYTVIYQKESEGGYTATVPALPGCVSYGRNMEEAQKMIAEAIEGYILTLKKRRMKIPRNIEIAMSSVDVPAIKPGKNPIKK